MRERQFPKHEKAGKYAKIGEFRHTDWTAPLTPASRATVAVVRTIR
jgi:hypothetical protein